ncbi:MAG: type II toxin-antitoxin system RelE/ParE family toxin [Chloroflexi bacterium]|nr:type II toxin-antitoxin system RelE/ParE family toxin [Chloroflexota bacterium]
MPMKIWRFYDFYDARQRNRIHEWLDGLPRRAKARIQNLIVRLEVTEQWEPQYVSALKGECKGLIELRITVNGVQYRPIGCYGPDRHEFTLLVGTVEKGSRLEPRDACAIAHERWAMIKENRSYCCVHDFS